MNATHQKLVLRKVPKESDKSYIWIRFRYNGETKFKALGRKITTKNFKKSGDGVTSLEQNHKEINEEIQRELNLLRGTDSKKYVEDKIFKKHQILPYIQKVIDTTPNQGTLSIRKATKKKFEGYLTSIDKLDLTFKELTPHLLDSFNLFMVKDGLRGNSANQYLQTLQLFVNYAKKDEAINLPDKYNPFNRMKFKRSPIRNKALSQEELKLFGCHIWKKEKHNIYRDMFMFQLYGGGLRVSDVLTLTWDNLYVKNDCIFLDYRTVKTDKKMVANLFHNGLEYLNYPLSKFFPVFQQVAALKKELKEAEEQYEESKYELDNRLADRAFSAANKEDRSILRVKMREDRIADLRNLKFVLEIKVEEINKNIVDFYKEKIQALHLAVPNELVFPFLWDEAASEPKINMNVELMSQEDYEKVNNERSKYNQQIKRMGKELGIKTPITTHSSRHTFTQLLLESNVNTHYISMALGHNSIGTTELYRRTLTNTDALQLNLKLPKL